MWNNATPPDTPSVARKLQLSEGAVEFEDDSTSDDDDDDDGALLSGGLSSLKQQLEECKSAGLNLDAALKEGMPHHDHDDSSSNSE
jgi:hypothetical protein